MLSLSIGYGVERNDSLKEALQEYVFILIVSFEQELYQDIYLDKESWQKMWFY